MPAEIMVIEPTGYETQVIAKFAGQEMSCVFRERLSGGPGDRIGLSFEGPLHFFDAQTGAAHRRLPSHLIVMGSILKGAAALIIFGPLLIPVAGQIGITHLAWSWDRWAAARQACTACRWTDAPIYNISTTCYYALF